MHSSRNQIYLSRQVLFFFLGENVLSQECVLAFVQCDDGTLQSSTPFAKGFPRSYILRFSDLQI